MKPVIAIVLAGVALAGCRMVQAYPSSIKDPPMPRFCANEEDRRLPSGVCVRRSGDREHVWRKERRYPWIAGGNPYAREFYDQEDARNGGSHNE